MKQLHLFFWYVVLLVSSAGIQMQASEPENSQLSFDAAQQQSYIKKVSPYLTPFAAVGVLTYLAYAAWKEYKKPDKVTNFVTNYQVLTPQSLQQIIQLIADHQALSGSAGGGAKADQFQQSGARVYLPGDVTMRLDEVIGGKRIKSDVQDVLYFLKHPEKYEEFGIRVPKGLIFSGPPGCGKTMIAKALAGEANAPFLYISGSEFSQMYVGVGAARVKHLFDQARELAGQYGSCLIFIDEIDVVGHRRNYGLSGGDSEHAQTLNQLLACMDGFDEQEDPIIVVGATNRFEVIDEALLRPGRFDKKVSFDLPRYKERVALLKHYFEKLARVDVLNFDLLARVTKGFSAAEIANLVNESAQVAFNEALESGIDIDLAAVQAHHVETAYDNQVLGKMWNDAVTIPRKELYKTAVHEAGHALMCALLLPENPVYKVSIQPRGWSLGVTHFLPAADGINPQKDDFLSHIVVALGGSVAEEVIFGGSGPGKSNDLQKARNIVMNMLMEYGMSETLVDVSFAHIHSLQELSEYAHREIELEAQAIISKARMKCKQLMTEHKEHIEQIAALLMEKELISGADVYTTAHIDVPQILQDFIL